MSDKFDKLFDDEPGKDFEDRVMKRVDSILDEKARARGSWLDALLRPALGLGFTAAAAAALVLYWHGPADPGPEALTVAEETEMVRDADMLLELPLLKDWPAVEKLEKKREWKKKRG